MSKIKTYTPEEEQDIKDLFISVAANDDEDIGLILDESPHLLMVQDEDGDNLLLTAISKKTAASLETARVICSYATPEQLEELSNTPNLLGITARGYLDTFNQPTLENLKLLVEFSEVMGLEGYRKRAQDKIIQMHKDGHPHAQEYAAALGIDLNTDRIVLSVNNINYNFDFNDIYSNMEQKKKIDQEIYNNINKYNDDYLLDGISFAPVMYNSLSSDLSIMVLPKEIAELTYEQISNFFGKLSEFYYGLDS